MSSALRRSALLLVLAPGLASAQFGLNWATKYDGPTGRAEEVNALVADPATGESYAVGSTVDVGNRNTGQNWLVVKHAANGRRLWARSYSFSSFQLDGARRGAETIRSAVLAPNGDLLVTGEAWTPKAGRTWQYARVTPNGAFTQITQFDNPTGTLGNWGVAVGVLPNGNAVVLGNSFRGATNAAQVVCIRPDGTVAWWSRLRFRNTGDLDADYNGTAGALAIGPTGEIGVSGSSGVGAFVARLQNSNGRILYTFFPGVSGVAGVSPLAWDRNRNLYFTGLVRVTNNSKTKTVSVVSRLNASGVLTGQAPVDFVPGDDETNAMPLKIVMDVNDRPLLLGTVGNDSVGFVRLNFALGQVLPRVVVPGSGYTDLFVAPNRLGYGLVTNVQGAPTVLTYDRSLVPGPGSRAAWPGATTASTCSAYSPLTGNLLVGANVTATSPDVSVFAFGSPVQDWSATVAETARTLVVSDPALGLQRGWPSGLTTSLRVAPTSGLLTVRPDGTLRYTVSDRFNGLATFYFQHVSPRGDYFTGYLPAEITVTK